MGKCFAALIGFWVLAAAGLASGPGFAACTPDEVDLRWPGGGQARFSVEIADTEALREKGLMFRDTLSSSAGMLFVYDVPEHAHFWMKNTLIPLDMVFADQKGRVTVVHSDAVPGDETPIDGGEGVAYVLEIKGGLAKRMGIVPGADLRTERMDQSLALWSCAN
jgi:uncharacterized membrane protein (UPF0127 family)